MISFSKYCWLFPKWLYQFMSLPATYESSSCSHTASPTVGIIQFLKFELLFDYSFPLTALYLNAHRRRLARGGRTSGYFLLIWSDLSHSNSQGSLFELPFFPTSWHVCTIVHFLLQVPCTPDKPLEGKSWASLALYPDHSAWCRVACDDYCWNKKNAIF